MLRLVDAIISCFVNPPEGTLWESVLELRKEFELVDDDDEELPAASTVGMILEGLIVSMVVPGEVPNPHAAAPARTVVR